MLEAAAKIIGDRFRQSTDWPRMQVRGVRKVNEGLPDKTFIDSLGNFAGNRRGFLGPDRIGHLPHWFNAPLRRAQDIAHTQEAVRQLGENETLWEFSRRYIVWSEFFLFFGTHDFRHEGVHDGVRENAFNRTFDEMLDALKFCGGLASRTDSAYLKTILETFGEVALALDPVKAQIKSKLDHRSVNGALAPAAEAMQHLDALTTLAGALRASRTSGIPWTFPAIVESEFPFIQIDRGVHPVLDLQYRASKGNPPQPVSVALGQSRAEGPRALGTVITGPNEFGKTTILKMIALMALLGQVGGPVPAESVSLSPFANLLIFSSWGNQDLNRGISGFAGEVEQWGNRDLLGPDTLLVYDEPNITTRYRQGRALTFSTWENLLLPSRTTWAMASHIEDGLEEFHLQHPEMQMLQVGTNFNPENPNQPKDYSLTPGVNRDEYTLPIAARFLPEEVIAGAKKYL